MARVMRRPSVGVSPTNAQKLAYVSKKLGLDGIAKMQGAAFNLFDTVLVTDNLTNRQTLNFFTQTANKSRSFTNFQQGILNAGEAMLIEYVTFYHAVLTNTDLTSEANLYVQINPLSALQFVSGAWQGLLNFNIANDTVIKDYLIYEVVPAFNPSNTGIAVAGVGSPQVGSSQIQLPATPVIPPNQKIKMTLEIPAVSGFVANSAIICVIGRMGSIFSSKTTL